MKKSIALFICIATIFVFTGCKKQSINEIEQKITKQLTDTEYMDANINGKIFMNIPDAGLQTITIDANYKMDVSGDSPKISLDGNFGLEGVMSIPLSLYIDENNTTTNIMGQSQQTPISDETKSQIKMLLGKDRIRLNLSKTTTETTYNNMRAIQLAYDVNTINNFAAFSSKTGLNNLTCYYLLGDNNELDSMVVILSVTSEGEKIDMEFTIKYNSLNKPVEITPISTTRNMPLLTNDQTTYNNTKALQ